MDNQPAMSLNNGGIGNAQGQELSNEAIKSANKVLNKYYDKHAEDTASQPGGIEILQHLVTKANLKEEANALQQKSAGDQAQNVITPEHISLIGKILNNTAWGQNLQSSKLDNLQKVSDIQNAGGGQDTEQSIQRMADLNKIIDNKLPGYQVTQNADGSFAVHPKAAGVMSQLNPQELDSMSNSLVNGDQAPSQLPRIQKGQVIAAALAKDPTYSPAKADMEFAANKMGASSFERNYNNLDSFHKDFEKNSDYLLNLSKNFDRNKLPIINKIIVAGGKGITGDPKSTQLIQAVNTVANGYARLQNPTLAGQALSDASRKEAQDLINGFQSDTQLRSLLDPKEGSMRIDAQNRIDAAQEVRDRIKGTYGKSNKSDTSNSVKSGFKVISVR